MKLKPLFLLIICLSLFSRLLAQTVAAPRPHVIDKTDIIAFHRQILGLKEYTEERSKIPALQKANKVSVKIKAIVDTVAVGNGDDDETKSVKLTGYIRQEIGDNSVNLYEITFDRSKKKITAVVPTGDTLENAKIAKAKPEKNEATKKVGSKKEEDEDDDEEEKPVKKKDADKDDDN